MSNSIVWPALLPNVETEQNCASVVLGYWGRFEMGPQAAAGEMQHWVELVPNAWRSEIWHFGPLCLDVLEQKAHKSVSSQMRTFDVTFTLTGSILGRKKKRSRFLKTVLPFGNALFVSILLYRSSPGQVSIQKGETAVLQAGKCPFKYMCISTVYAYKDTYPRKLFVPQF